MAVQALLCAAHAAFVAAASTAGPALATALPPSVSGGLELCLLQTKADLVPPQAKAAPLATGHRPNTSRHERTEVVGGQRHVGLDPRHVKIAEGGQTQEQELFQSGEGVRSHMSVSHSVFARNLLVVNETLKEVKAVIEIVNSTTAESVAIVMSTGSGFTTALEQAKANAQRLEGVLGREVVTKQAKLFERLSEAIYPLTEQLVTSYGHMQELLDVIIENFRATARTLVIQFEVAFDAVQKVSQLRDAPVSFSQTDKAQGLLDWFKSTFLGATEGSPCNKAKLRILEANATATRLGRMLLALNKTANTNFLDGAVISIDGGMQQLEAVKQTGTSTYSSGLPPRIVQTVNATVNALSDVVEQAHGLVVKAQRRIEMKLVRAFITLRGVHEAARGLLLDRDAACVGREVKA